MDEIIFITRNKGKFEEAQGVFLNTGIKLAQNELKTPEIQSDDAEEIARYSAEFAGEKLKRPLFVLDRSFHIRALNGFPGPYVKFVNNCLTVDQILAMLKDSPDRKAFWVSAVGCYIPGRGIKTMVGKIYGVISNSVGNHSGYMVDRIFIPEGKTDPLCELNRKERKGVWDSCSCWEQLINYLKN
jgi:XTP/dITP diphosphohydrolase